MLGEKISHLFPMRNLMKTLFLICQKISIIQATRYYFHKALKKSGEKNKRLSFMVKTR